MDFKIGDEVIIIGNRSLGTTHGFPIGSIGKIVEIRKVSAGIILNNLHQCVNFGDFKLSKPIMKYKEGDLVKIVARKHGHGLAIGQEVIIKKVEADGYSVGDVGWLVKDYEIELVQSLRTCVLTKETAIEMYNSGIDSLKKLAVENYSELGVKPLPKTWEELEELKGYFVESSYSNVLSVTDGSITTRNYNVFLTEEQAKASLALAQLSQLMNVYNEGWVPDWKNSKEKKHVIIFYQEDISLEEYNLTRKFLSFKTKEIAELFLKNFKDLILQAKPLL